MATLIFTSGVFEGCIIDDKGQWKDELECRTYSKASKKLQLLFHKWMRKSGIQPFNEPKETFLHHLNIYWDIWLLSWETEIWDNSNADYIWDRTEF